jgi:hypothetical protein
MEINDINLIGVLEIMISFVIIFWSDIVPITCLSSKIFTERKSRRKKNPIRINELVIVRLVTTICAADIMDYIGVFFT